MLTPRKTGTDPATVRAGRAAAACSLFMIAAQVAGKATRDALFLTHFPVTTLPYMLMGAALLSLGAVALLSRLQARRGPGRTVPAAFALSALLFTGWWILARTHPKPAAVGLYAQSAVLGAALISGFWSVVNERFDPRSAKRRIARIAAGGTLGGLVGGLAAERVGALASITGTLPILALLHLACFAILRGVRPAAGPARIAGKEGEEPSGFRTLGRTPYLRDLAALVLLVTAAGTMIDYVFKAEAARSVTEGSDLMRFFALYYTAVSLLTFLVQSGAGRSFLERFGLVRAVASLPAVIAAGGVGMLALPGIAAATAARGLESVFRSSLYRSGYELLYTPVPTGEKRAAKPVIDVGFERLGDLLGGGAVRLLLLLPAAATSLIVSFAVILAAAVLLIARRLHSGYVSALEASLVARSVDLGPEEAEDRTTRSTIMQTLSGVRLSGDFGKVGAGGEGDLPGGSAPPGGEGEPPDPKAEILADLRSADPVRVRRALRSADVADPAVAERIVTLLAWNEVTADAAKALVRVAREVTDLLVDRLLDTDEEFTIRRRLPRVLAYSPTDRAVDGLIRGLGDRRFEVRFRAGRALLRLRRSAEGPPIDPDRIIEAILREVGVDRRVWTSQRLYDKDGSDEEGDSPFVDELLRERAGRSLEHVFTLLALVLPEEPLRIAFRGLCTGDDGLRGTALEYLESVLPEPVRKDLWPFLEGEERPRGDRRSREEILDELLRSNQSIEVRLEELRGRTGDSAE